MMDTPEIGGTERPVYADMVCPQCGARNSKVVDSRAARAHIRRRRECLMCNHRYTTREIYADDAARRSEVSMRLGIIEEAIALLRDDLGLK